MKTENESQKFGPRTLSNDTYLSLGEYIDSESFYFDGHVNSKSSDSGCRDREPRECEECEEDNEPETRSKRMATRTQKKGTKNSKAQLVKLAAWTTRALAARCLWYTPHFLYCLAR